MSSVEIVTVEEFKGLRRGLRSGNRSQRRRIDEPREMKNLLLDESNHIWMPRAPLSEFASISGEEEKITRIWNVTAPTTAIIVQLGTRVVGWVTDPYGGPVGSQLTVISNVNSDDPLWTLETDGFLYMGNESNTWKVSWTGSSFSATALGSAVPHGFDSQMYRGRRFILRRNKTVVFSGLNQPESFGSDDTFVVGGDSTGGIWAKSPGSVVALSEFQDYLVIFCTQSIWILSGTTPENMQLRRTPSITGVWARDSIVHIEDGVLFFGGTPRGEYGIYLFTGGDARLVSQPITAFFRRWGQLRNQDMTLFAEATREFHAVRWNDAYILSAETIRTDDMSEGDGRQVYVYHFQTGAWTTFDGWSPGPAIGLAREGRLPDRLFVSQGRTIYRTNEPFCRPPEGNAYLTVGWDDEGHTSGYLRFLALKVAGWRVGGDEESLIRVTATSSDGPSVTRELPIPTNVFNGLVIPLNIRGKGIELQLEVIPSTPNEELVLEQLQLVTSRKGEKVSR